MPPGATDADMIDIMTYRNHPKIGRKS